MEKELDLIISEYDKGNIDSIAIRSKLLNLFNTRKRQLIEDILDDVKNSHPEYAVEKIENYLDDEV